MTFIHWLSIACGGFIGAILRYQLTERLNHAHSKYPMGTWLVNMVGSFIIGVCAALHMSVEWKMFIIAGMLGAFTTYSTVQKELFTIWQQQQYRTFWKYGLWTYGGGLVCVTVGYMVGQFV